MSYKICPIKLSGVLANYGVNPNNNCEPPDRSCGLCEEDKCALWVRKCGVFTEKGTEDISECGLINR